MVIARAGQSRQFIWKNRDSYSDIDNAVNTLKTACFHLALCKVFRAQLRCVSVWLVPFMDCVASSGGQKKFVMASHPIPTRHIGADGLGFLQCLILLGQKSRWQV